MGGSSGSTQTTVQSSEPAAWAAPHLTTIASKAQDLYNSGSGFSYYPDSTVTPMSSQTTSALTGIEGLANQGAQTTNSAIGATQGLLNSGGMTSAQQSALNPLSQIATGQNQITTGAGYQGLLNGQQPNAVSQYLTDTAAGKNLNGTPEFQAMLDDQAARTMHDVGSSASMAGRYGSGAMGDAAARAVASQRNSAVAQNYQQERANQMSAANLLSSEQQTGLSNKLNALSGLTNVQGTNLANQAGSAMNLFNAGSTANSQMLNAANMAPTLDQAAYMPYQQLQNVGQAYENQSNAELQDKISRYNSNQQQPFQQLQAYSDMINGVSRNYGTTASTTNKSNNQSWLQTGLGGLLTLGSFL